jgi:outer membrane protease
MDESEISETTLLSQNALSQDWERPEEDEAWSHHGKHIPYGP